MLGSKPGLFAGLLWLVPLAAASAASPAPVVDLTGQGREAVRAQPQSAAQAEQPRLTLDQRLEKLERQVDNQALLEMLQRVETLTQEVQQLRGTVEEQAHTIEGLKQRQRDLYLDVDRRLSSVERGGQTPSSMTAPGVQPDAAAQPGSEATTPPGPAKSQASSNPLREQEEYQKAFNVLKEGRYEQAITDFSAFLKTYPSSALTDNAQYWLGEAYYVTRRFDEAAREFDKVAGNQESRKRADAMLKLGYTHYELQKWPEARKVLEQVVARYPGNTVARLAEKRLQDLRAAGH